MKRARRFPRRSVRWMSLSVCFALVLSSLTLIAPISRGSGFIPQGRNGQTNNGRSKRVAAVPPQPGAPAANLPNLDEVRQRRIEAPRAPQPIPSTLRSRRKPLELRPGRKVGDPLPPKLRAGANEQQHGRDRVIVAGNDARGRAGSVRSHHARIAGPLRSLDMPLLPTESSNVALASNGATASASSVYTWCSVNGAQDGDRRGVNYGQHSTWGGAAPTFPQWLQIDFNGPRTIDEIDLFTVQDNYANPAEPTVTMTFSLYGLTGFELQYWNGAAWATVPGGSVTGNNKVWRKFNFSAITTTRIRLVTLSSPSGWSEVTELEAWTASSSSTDYVQNFFQQALGRTPSPEEGNYWEDILRAAYVNGPGSVKIAVREMARTIFESADYAARGRNNHWYVYDLYEAYLGREPNAQDWAFWEGECNSYGREQVRHAFDVCGEFDTVVAALQSNGAPSSTVSSLLTARVDPFNQPGDQLLGRDAEWAVSLLSLPGRAGLDLGLGLAYSSAVWTRSGPYSYFDEDNGTLSPGFRLGFPTVQEVFFDARVGVNARLLITPSGHRVELRQVGTSNVYEAADSSYLQLIDYGSSLSVRSTDGIQMSYEQQNDEWRCNQIEDRNGNLITITNNHGEIVSIVDTLGRTIVFHYDNGNLTSITQTWNGQTHTWASFGWGTVPMQPTLTGVVGTHSGEVIPVLNQVGLDDGSRYNFEYNANGQVNLIRRYTTPDNVQRWCLGYDYALDADNSPRLTGQRVWAEHWTGSNGVPNEVVTHFGLEGDKHTLSVEGDPNGTVYKESYGTGWRRGLTIGTEVWAGGSLQKTTTTSWTQDNPAPNVNYQTNPRMIETNVVDSAGNHSRTAIGYDTFTLPSGTSCSLPNNVDEYDGNAIYRRTHTDYQKDTNYLNARVIGLPLTKLVYEGTSTLVAKSTYVYDWGGEYLQNPPATPTQHNGGYSTDFVVGRGNLVDVLRWDVTDPNNSAKALESKIAYDIDGSVVFTRDALNHKTTISYNDSFSANGTNLDAPRSFATFAYPTMVTDADNYSSSLWYRYDIGSKTRAEGPPPDNQPNGIIQTFGYDDAARIKQVTTANTGAYTYYEYGPNYTQVYSSVNNVTADPHAADSYSVQILDGLGRVIASARNHPTTNGGGYSAVVTVYDRTGRAIQQSNPTDTSASGSTWPANGDDSVQSGGYDWVYTQQTYDWKGRPRITTNPSITGNPNDTTAREVSYTVCGCAGSDIVTLTDEVGRQQKVYSDALARTAKTEALNWDGTVYSTTVNTYNGRDQVTLVRQNQGPEGSGIYQDTTMSYDGYGRLQTKHVPEQNAGTATVYVYNADDTVYSVTDARGASSTFTYNARHLVTHASYFGPTVSAPGSNIPSSPAVDFDYDAVGNRLWMNEDNQRRVTYHYDAQSRMDWEERHFPGLSGAYKLSYEYNLAGAVRKVIDETAGTSFTATRDIAGRLTGVSAVGYGGLVTQFASQMQYRAWGALKSMAYGNSTNLALGYNARGLVTTSSVGGVRLAGNGGAFPVAGAYQYYSDAQPKFAQDQSETNSIKDRAFKYDNAGRLAEAYSGAEARDVVNNTSGGAADGPFRQSYAYDAWDNMRNDTWRFWSRSGVTTTNYNNTSNRNSDWTYDADGNLISRNEPADNGFPFQPARHSYDAAGREASVTQTRSYFHTGLNQLLTDVFTNTQTYDGDGQLVRYVQHVSENGSQGVDYLTTYHLRSSVLGGRVISEYNGQGAWTASYVYAGSERVGTQRKNADGSAAFNEWRQVNPVTRDELHTNKDGYFIGQATFDPQGVDVGGSDPFPPDGSGDGDLFPDDPSVVNGAGKLFPVEGGGSGCVLDGIKIDCSFIRDEATAQCPDNDCGPRVRKDGTLSQPFRAFADGWGGFLPQGTNYLGNGKYASPGPPGDRLEGRLEKDSERKFAHAPQNPIVVGATPDEEGLIGAGHADALKRLQVEPCAKLFGGADKGAQTLNGIAWTIDRDLPSSGHPGAIVGPGTLDYINPNGAFLTPDGSSWKFGLADPSGKQGYQITLTGAQARAFAELHEGVHKGKAHGFKGTDNDDPRHSRLNGIINNYKIWKACFPEVTAKPTSTLPPY